MPLRDVIKRVPPWREVASPREETKMSILVPGFTKGGRSAVTMTAATFLTFKAVGATVMSILLRRLERLCLVKPVWSLSPVPFKPTTRP